jgi:V/A-type H+-transporting ATPase subunit E
LEALFDKIIKDDVIKAYDASLIAKAIPEVLKAWAGGKEGGVDVILNEKDLSSVEAACKGQLQEAVKGGAEFKTARGIEAGFHVALKDGSAYYDFSADQIANALAAYLNPKLADTLKNAAQEK